MLPVPAVGVASERDAATGTCPQRERYRPHHAARRLRSLGSRCAIIARISASRPETGGFGSCIAPSKSATRRRSSSSSWSNASRSETNAVEWLGIERTFDAGTGQPCFITARFRRRVRRRRQASVRDERRIRRQRCRADIVGTPHTPRSDPTKRNVRGRVDESPCSLRVGGDRRERASRAPRSDFARRAYSSALRTTDRARAGVASNASAPSNPNHADVPRRYQSDPSPIVI